MPNIIFRPNSKEAELTVAKPVPAKNYLPNWFKQCPMHTTDRLEFDSEGESNLTMKACVPFVDTFLTGYIQETWCDVYINTNTGEYRFSTSPQIMTHRAEDKQHYPKIQNFNKQEFVWHQVWIPELPEGYSMLYTHPLNRYDLPFKSLSGIIDHDGLIMEKIATHPFFIQEGFEGIIPKGTPMFQMIPIKRESWQSSFEEYNENLLIESGKIRQFFTGGYKKLFWKKKDYK